MVQLNKSDGSNILSNSAIIPSIVEQVENDYKKDSYEISQICIKVPIIEFNGDGIAWVIATIYFWDMRN